MNKNHLFLIGLLFLLWSCGQSENRESKTNEIQEIKPENLSLLSGTYTGDGSDGVYLLNFDPVTGEIELEGLVLEERNPSFISISQGKGLVYISHENDSSYITACAWDEEEKTLTILDQKSFFGQWACHINQSADGFKIGVANYGTGNGLIYTSNPDGTLNSNPAIFQHEGSGPVEGRQEGPHAHSITFSPNGNFAFAADLGIDQLVGYPLKKDGSAAGEYFTAFQSTGGDGPRHMTFHPNGEYAYVVNELSSTVDALKYNAEDGTFESIDRESTLPDGFDGQNSCADIHITKNGKFLYASNRGHNSIAIFTVSEDGTITHTGNEPVQGSWPRNFTLAPNDQFLLVANQRSNNITVFSVDSSTGKLDYTGNSVELSQPVCLKFFE